MTYRAVSLHEPLLEAKSAAGQVFGAYARALNLLLDSGEVISLVHPDLGNGPGAVRAAGPWPLPWQPGDRVALAPGRLEGPGAVVLLAGGAPWRPPPAPALASGPELVSAKARVTQALAVAGSKAGILPAALAFLLPESAPPRPAGVPGTVYDMYMEGLRALAAGRWDEGIRRLAGLGPGSTPSGDDLLCGFACLLARAGNGSAAGSGALAMDAAEALGQAIGKLPPTATHPLSHHLLGWAPRGVAGERHLAFVDALLTGGGERELVPVLAFGAMSGADWAAGALLGLRWRLENTI